MSFQNPVRYSLDPAGRSSPFFVSLVLCHKTQPFSAAQEVCGWEGPGSLAASELVKHSGKTSLGEILCCLLSATKIVLNQKCLNHRENNWLFHAGSAPWEMHSHGVLQR